MTSAQAYVKLIAAKLALEFAEVAVLVSLCELEMALKKKEKRK